MSTPFLNTAEFLEHWQGHRNLTRRVIETFPEKELFEFSVGGMRTFAELAKELLAIAAPGLKEIVNRESVPFDEKSENIKTKADILKAWDESTEIINSDSMNFRYIRICYILSITKFTTEDKDMSI